MQARPSGSAAAPSLNLAVGAATFEPFDVEVGASCMPDDHTGNVPGRGSFADRGIPEEDCSEPRPSFRASKKLSCSQVC